MAHLLRTKSLFPNKRMGNVVAREDVQSVKRVCTDWTRCVSESECDSERETEYSTKQPNKQQITATRQRKKKRMTMTKEEKALEVAANIRGRMGFQQELLFRGKGKDSHQCFHSNVFVCGEQKGRDNRRDGDGSRISMAFEPSARMASTPRESMADKPSTSMAFEPSARLAFEPRESMTDEPKESSMALEPSARMAFEPRESMADEPNNSNSLASEPNNNGNENWWSWEDPPHEHTVHMRPPVFASGQPVTGSQVHRRQWKKDNKRRRQQQQLQQPPQNYWTTHDGCHESDISFSHPSRDSYRGGVCPSNLALKHPAAPLLNQYATDGCPVNTGRRWSRREIEAAAEYGNHPMTEEGGGSNAVLRGSIGQGATWTCRHSRLGGIKAATGSPLPGGYEVITIVGSGAQVTQTPSNTGFNLDEEGCRGKRAIGQCQYNKAGTARLDGSDWACPGPYHSCSGNGTGGKEDILCKVGCERWFLANGCQVGSRVEFLLHAHRT